MRRATVMCVVAAALGLVGCGGSDTSTSTVTSVGRSVGTGANRTWVFAPSQGKPRSVVVFLHGLGDQLETTPARHRPDHLLAAGFPPAKLKVENVRSTPEFQATHLSVLSDSEGARKASWQRADAFIDAARN